MISAPKAVVLLSGGLDSYTAAAIAKAEGFELYALTVSYGQVHAGELAAARRVAAALEVSEHLELAVDLASIGGSALTGSVPVPKDRVLTPAIPPTYVPARNTVLLSLALGWAEVLETRDLFIGVNAVDYSGYPDCRPEYLQAFERLAALATRAGVEGRPTRLHAPLLRSSKADIVRRGVELGLDFGLTATCYDPEPGDRPCERCDACRLRARGFAEAGISDPLLDGAGPRTTGNR